MRFFMLILCVLTAIPGLAAPQYEPDSKANDFIFYMPRGWNRVDRPDSTLLVAPLTSPCSSTATRKKTRTSPGSSTSSHSKHPTASPRTPLLAFSIPT